MYCTVKRSDLALTIKGTFPDVDRVYFSDMLNVLTRQPTRSLESGNEDEHCIDSQLRLLYVLGGEQ